MRRTVRANTNTKVWYEYKEPVKVRSWTRIKRVLCVKCDNMSLHEEMCEVTEELK